MPMSRVHRREIAGDTHRFGTPEDTVFSAVRRNLEGEEPDESIDKPRYSRHVYFLLDHDACEIKIGLSTNVKRRQTSLEWERGRKLELLGTMSGGDKLERAMHSRFRDHRKRGEWFSSVIAADVLQLIAQDQEWYEGAAA
jgi:hypothetical protein